MKLSRWLTLIMTCLIVTGCGQMAGNNPIGVTGGDDGGYGSFAGFANSVMSDSERLIGRWRNGNDISYTQYTFSSNGDFQLVQFWSEDYHIATGTYTAHDNILRIIIDGEAYLQAPFYFRGDLLVITNWGGETIFHRY